ncbi:sodium:solute symporter family protein [Thermanaeromonas sp. C210]|uniref:sodium:solute symporter family protein n=1 Tax=Thermanaeromonas sp. C210 TaxID=2731925 RepID=UPI00155C19FB|nr:sodium:solute symporter family protein [Thermanaeromonas sp. C210]GFN24179.1 pantothenate permease [Thermanaeromonas sp. C210]
MRGLLLALVIAYELIVIVGIGLYVAKKAESKGKGKDDFMLAGRDMPLFQVGATLALTILGTVHILGLFEHSWSMGVPSIWFSIAHVTTLAVICVATGRWVRRTGVSTIPELLEVLFKSKGYRTLVACAMAPLIWGILTLETQGAGIILSTLTGVSIREGAIIGAIFGVLYVYIAGMREIGAVNLANIAVMYAGVIVATAFLTFGLPAGWDGVAEYYVSTSGPEYTSVFGSWEIFLAFGLSNVFAVTFFQGISQKGLSGALAARDEATVRKALWIAAPLNGLFGVFTVSMGMAAKSMPEFNALGPKLAAPTMLAEMLPWWLAAWLLASFLGAVLSTYAVSVLAPATLFVKDIYVPLYNPNASEAEQTRMVRIVVLVLGLLALLPAATLPPIVGAILWLFSWLVPVFWFVVFGLFWKRSTAAAVITTIAAWIATCVWSFTSLPSVLGWQSVHNVYITCLVTGVLGIILTAVLPGEKGLFRNRGGRFASGLSQAQ